jgi:apolipoprotein N-acyltransferase
MALMKWARRFGRLRAMSCGVLFALLLILSFPPFGEMGMWWLALFTPLPLLVVARDTVIRPSRAAFFVGLGTLPAWLWTHWWMWDVTVMGTPFLMCYLMAYPAIFVWVGNRISSRIERAWIVLPVVYVGIEYLRAHAAFTGYPWYLGVQPLVDSPRQVLAGPAAIAGNSGMYVVGLLSAVFIWQVWRAVCGERVVRRMMSAAAVLLIWIGLGLLGLSWDNEEGETLNVGIVQLNVPQDNRMEWTDRQRYLDWTVLRDLTVASSRDEFVVPDVIVWPEGFVPGWTFDPISLEHERANGLTWSMMPRHVDDAPGLWGMPDRIDATSVVDELLVMQKGIGVPLIVGSVAFDNLEIVRDDKDWVQYTNDGMYNSAFLVEGGEISSVWYNKMHLTPFGEVMPVISNWEWLEQSLLGLGATGMEFILSAGDDPVVLEVDAERVGGITVGTPICFEATVPGVCRALVFDGSERRAGLLANLTNDGWFGSSDVARRSHMLIARWRCIELQTPMIRSANTGFSCVIGKDGGVLEDELSMVDPNDERIGYLNAAVKLGAGRAFPGSGLIGAVFGWAMLGLSAAGLILTFVQKRSEPAVGTDV